MGSEGSQLNLTLTLSTQCSKLRPLECLSAGRGGWVGFGSSVRATQEGPLKTAIFGAPSALGGYNTIGTLSPPWGLLLPQRPRGGGRLLGETGAWGTVEVLQKGGGGGAWAYW